MFRIFGTYEQTSTAGETANAFVAGIRLFELLPAHPIITVAEAVKLLKTTKPTATKAVFGLVEAGILVETTGRRRDRAYSYEAYLNLLRAGTEPE
jgi:Fic family protein